MDYRILDKKKEVQQRAADEKFKQQSKERLRKIIETKITTSFIGALSAFEAKFGHLWGHGSSAPLTPEQQQFKKIWDEVRTEILNNGNNQKRLIVEELRNNTIHWDRFTYSVPIRSLDQNDKTDI